MEEHVRVNGARLWTRREGSGPPLVMLHGGPGGSDDFDAIAAPLAAHLSVYRYEQRGSPRSEAKPPYDVATFVADLEALRRHWQIERWFLFGHSWGAGLGLAWALEHPDRVRGLVHSAGLGLPRDAAELEAWAAELRRRTLARLTPAQRERLDELTRLRETGRLDAEGLIEHRALRHSASYPDPEASMERARAAVRSLELNDVVNDAVGGDWSALIRDRRLESLLPGLRAPVLVLQGAEDIRPDFAARGLAARLPNASFRTLEGLGHEVRPHQTEAFARVVLDFALANA